MCKHYSKIPCFFITILIVFLGSTLSFGQSRPPKNKVPTAQSNKTPMGVKSCKDFTLTGKGENPEWASAEWNDLNKLDAGGKEYQSRFKILYSSKGIYVLFQGEDSKITTQDYADFGNIFNGDVFEVFFHPDPTVIEYFEYEVNQLDKELILMFHKHNGKSYSWIPWHHDSNRADGIRKVVDVVGGEKQLDSSIQSWSAEIFYPYVALGLLPNVPPIPGTIWNANFCRLDYDSGIMIKWSWSPTIETSFHELDKFQSIRFE